MTNSTFLNNEIFFPDGYQAQFLPGAFASWEEREYLSSVTGTKRKMNIILPKDYEKGGDYPILYLLHGIGGDENEWKGAGPEFLSANLVSEKKAKEMIIVLANVRARADDRANPADIFTKEHFEAFDAFEKELIADIMPFMEKHYRIKTGREHTAIGGLSMGGRETLFIGLTHPDQFGYIGAFSPAFGLLPYENNGVREEGLLKEEGFILKPGYEDNTYVLMIHGDNDIIVRDTANRYHACMEKNGMKNEFHMVPGGHDFGVWTLGLYYYLQQIF